MVFEYKNHTADMEIVVSAGELEEVFSDMTQAVTKIICQEQVREQKTFPIEITAQSLESLLFDFLDELIFLLDTQSFIGCRLECELFFDASQWVLDGIVYGDDITKYEHHGDLKAPTYHKLSVQQEGDVWVAHVVIDL
jgi:SHS2 domain-containing protein